MSEGLRPYDFVQQVYYAQEKVLLDFWPDDDKYKEVLIEANLVLQELQNAEDWTWLREQLVLGSCHGGPNEIPEFELPEWVYKISTLNHDAVRLHPLRPHPLWNMPGFPYPGRDYDEFRFIEVPIASSGDTRYRKEHHIDKISQVHMPDIKLRAIKMGNILTFNRPLLWHEEHSIAIVDVQRRIQQFHVCDHTCKGVNPDAEISYEFNESGEWTNPCSKIEPIMLTEIPDPNYVVMATAARHAEGSPPALARVAGLQDAAQKIMSAMRQNDASATDADYQDWDPIGYIQVI